MIDYRVEKYGVIYGKKYCIFLEVLMAKKNDRFRDVKKSNMKYTPTSKVGVVSGSKENKNVGTSILIFFLVLVVIGLGIGVVFSPSFDVTEVVVQDGIRVTSGEISNIANVNIGENILKQNYKAIIDNVVSMPYIKDARVKLLFPDKIEIIYTEREPYALIKYLESYVVVDKFGYILEIKKENDLNNLPIIYGIDTDYYDLGEMLKDTSRIKYQNVVTLLETAKQRNFPYEIYEIDYEKTSELKFWVKGKEIDIIYGDIDKNIISDKLSYLSGVLEKLGDKKGKLDISSESYMEMKTIFSERY